TVTERIPVAMLDMYQRRAELAIEYNLHPIAIKVATEIIKYRPDRATGYQLRARAYFGNQEFNKALNDLMICIRMQPHDARLYYQRARIYRLIMQPEAAAEDMRRARELLPGVFEQVITEFSEKSIRK
ncbi:MAG TPA: hypothetical protein VJZ27_19285, partial [Aggregatilineales bacterium]|nr:hypothetical protein [Aggregatilineales bacterium]